MVDDIFYQKDLGEVDAEHSHSRSQKKALLNLFERVGRGIHDNKGLRTTDPETLKALAEMDSNNSPEAMDIVSAFDLNNIYSKVNDYLVFRHLIFLLNQWIQMYVIMLMFIHPIAWIFIRIKVYFISYSYNSLEIIKRLRCPL